MLNEAELEAEIASMKQLLTSQQLATLTINTDTFPGNLYISAPISMVIANIGEM